MTQGTASSPCFRPGEICKTLSISTAPATLRPWRVTSAAPRRLQQSWRNPVGRDLRQRLGLRVPDLTIAFVVDRRRIINDRGYSIEDQGKPPDFVLEVASENTGQRDIQEKRENYAAFGIPEYWRFDPSGGLYHGVPLAGDRLEGGVYRPIDIVQVDDAHYWGRSEILGLDLCWEEELLRWYDPAAGRYLRTFDEEAEEHIAAEEQVRELEERSGACGARVGGLRTELQRTDALSDSRTLTATSSIGTMTASSPFRSFISTTPLRRFLG